MATDKKISDLQSASVVHPTDTSVLVSNGADYQYSFSTLLQYISSGVDIGAAITFGTALPQNTTGNNGDVFINTATNSFAQKNAGNWTVIYTSTTTSAADGTVLYGLSVPANSIGNNNDTYIDTGTGIFYQKNDDAWAQVFSMQTGPAGPAGAPGTNGTNGVNGQTILNGITNPANTLGNNGDFYINTSNWYIFGPKAAGAWPAGASIEGQQGDSAYQIWLDQGNAGSQTDFINALKGLTGATGAQGLQGPAGAMGPQGPSGINGNGIPTAGTTGQVLAKNSNADYDTEWVTVDGGIGGLVSSEILFGKIDGTIDQDSGLQFNTFTKTLEIGSPAANISTNIAVFLGDSITSGGGVTAGGTRWSTLVASALGLTENTFGVGGATVASYSQTNIPAKTTAMQYLFIAFGTNDAAAATPSGYTTAQFQADYTIFLNACISKGWAYDEIILVSTYGCSTNGTTQATYEAFNTVIENLASANNTLAYVNTYLPLLAIGYPSSVLTNDNLHPNNFANILISQLMLTELGFNNFILTNQKLAINGPAVFSNIKILNPTVGNTGQTIALFDANSNIVRGYALPAELTTAGLIYLGGGLRNPLAADFFSFNAAEDILLPAGARIGAGNNNGAYILLYNPNTGIMEFHNYYSQGGYVFYSKPNGVEISAFTINADGTVTPNVGVTMPPNKMISSSNAGTNSIQLFDNNGDTNFILGYEAGAFYWFVPKGIRNAQNLAMTLDASGNLSLNGATSAFALNKMTTVERNALSAVEGMEIYNTDTHSKNFYNGSSWQQLTSTTA